MNRNTTKLYEYLQELVDVIRIQVQDTLAEEGDTCGCCLARQFYQDNETRILSELYSVTKEDPEGSMNALMRFNTLNKAVSTLTEEIALATFQLNEEELLGKDI